MKYLAVLLLLIATPVMADDRALRARAAAAAVAATFESRPVANAARNVIEWVSELDAWQTRKPIWIHVTDDPARCSHCRRANDFHEDQRTVEASQAFACVTLNWAKAGDRARIREYGKRLDRLAFPFDVFLEVEAQTLRTEPGCPTSVDEYITRFQ